MRKGENQPQQRKNEKAKECIKNSAKFGSNQHTLQRWEMNWSKQFKEVQKRNQRPQRWKIEKSNLKTPSNRNIGQQLYCWSTAVTTTEPPLPEASQSTTLSLPARSSLTLLPSIAGHLTRTVHTTPHKHWPKPNSLNARPPLCCQTTKNLCLKSRVNLILLKLLHSTPAWTAQPEHRPVDDLIELSKSPCHHLLNLCWSTSHPAFYPKCSCMLSEAVKVEDQKGRKRNKQKPIQKA